MSKVFDKSYNHSETKQKDILETRAELVVLRTSTHVYVENQAILQPILLDVKM